MGWDIGYIVEVARKHALIFLTSCDHNPDFLFGFFEMSLSLANQDQTHCHFWILLSAYFFAFEEFSKIVMKLNVNLHFCCLNLFFWIYSFRMFEPGVIFFATILVLVPHFVSIWLVLKEIIFEHDLFEIFPLFLRQIL